MNKAFGRVSFFLYFFKDKYSMKIILGDVLQNWAAYNNKFISIWTYITDFSFIHRSWSRKSTK